MRQRWIPATLALVGWVLISEAGAAEPRQIQTAVEKSVALLQRCGPEFFRKSGCIACHHQSVTSMAVGEARKRGIHVDEKTAREQLQVAAMAVKDFHEIFLERVDNPFNSAPVVGYFSL